MNEDQTSEVTPPTMPAMPPQMPLTPPSPPLLPAQTDPFYVTAEDRTMGMLVHLLALLTGLIGTLIIWLVKQDESRFVDYHGKEAINFQLTVLVLTFGLLIVGIITVVGLFVAIPAIWVIGIGAFVCEIMACLAANRGEWYQYPWVIRFIK